MAWTTELTQHLRYYLDDSDTTTYSDARLSRFIAFAAYEVVAEVGNNDFVIDITIPSIDPDPVPYKSLSALFVLKGAVIVIRNEIKGLSKTAGWKITDDKSTIDGREALKALQELLKGYLDAYEKAKTAYLLGDGSIGMAILSPYTSS